MTASNYAEVEILDWLAGNGAPAAVANVYVKMHLGDPGEDCTGNPAVETTRAAASFGAAAAGSVANDVAVTWTNVSTSETWSHFSLWDASTAGNPLAYGALSASKALTATDNAEFAIGALTVTCD